jgi:hypothetical protein
MASATIGWTAATGSGVARPVLPLARRRIPAFDEAFSRASRRLTPLIFQCAGRRRLRSVLACLACVAALVAGGNTRADSPRDVFREAFNDAVDRLISLYIDGGGLIAPVGRPATLVLFTGQEMSGGGGHASGGFKLRPLQMLGERRFAIIGAVGSGQRRETGRLALNRESESASARAHGLVGMEFDVWGGNLGLFAGAEYFQERAADPRGVVLRSERRIGARAQVDWWSHPTPETLLTLNLSVGTAKRDLWARVAYGWRLGAADLVQGFAGPEIAFSAAPRLARIRAGAHWSEIAFMGLKLRASGGVSKESGRRAGIYLTFGSYRAF